MGTTNLNVLGKYYNLSDLSSISFGGGQFSLCPIDARSLSDDSDQSILDTMCQSEGIIKYLPLLDFKSNNGNGEQFLIRIVQKTELGQGFVYAIRKDQCLAGMIMVDTPMFNKLMTGFEQWTISFFSIFENLGIMSAALPKVMYLLKTKIKVKELYAAVSQDNDKSMHLLEKLAFDEIDNCGWIEKDGGRAPSIFCCDLETLTFI